MVLALSAVRQVGPDKPVSWVPLNKEVRALLEFQAPQVRQEFRRI